MYFGSFAMFRPFSDTRLSLPDTSCILPRPPLRTLSTSASTSQQLSLTVVGGQHGALTLLIKSTEKPCSEHTLRSHNRKYLLFVNMVARFVQIGVLFLRRCRRPRCRGCHRSLLSLRAAVGQSWHLVDVLVNGLDGIRWHRRRCSI